MSKLFKIEISTYDRKCLDANVSLVIIPAYEGLWGIKRGHSNAICLLKPGIVEIEDEQQQRVKFAIGEGVCTITPNKVVLLVRSFERKEDIDRNHLQQSGEKVSGKIKKLENYSPKEQKKIIASLLRYQARRKLIS